MGSEHDFEVLYPELVYSSGSLEAFADPTSLSASDTLLMEHDITVFASAGGTSKQNLTIHPIRSMFDPIKITYTNVEAVSETFTFSIATIDGEASSAQ